MSPEITRVMEAEVDADEDSFWQRLKKRFDSGILVRVTNLGLGFILLTLLVAVGATNTGNNGLYILVALLLALLVVSGILSRWNVEKLGLEFEGPEEIFAGTPVRLIVRLKNKGTAVRRAILIRLATDDRPMLFPRVTPEREEMRGLDLIFMRRGMRKGAPVLVYSGYPIGLFRKGHVHAKGLERLVFPRVFIRPLPRPEPASREGDATHRTMRGRGTDIRNLREAIPGDDPRDIHWPQTARQGTVIVKERSAEQGRDAIVALDSSGPAGEAFEHAVSEAAGHLIQLLGRGDRAGLIAPGHFIPPASGPAQRRLLLTTLALVEQKEKIPLFTVPPGALIFRVRPETGRTSEKSSL